MPNYCEKWLRTDEGGRRFAGPNTYKGRNCWGSVECYDHRIVELRILRRANKRRAQGAMKLHCDNAECHILPNSICGFILTLIIREGSSDLFAFILVMGKRLLNSRLTALVKFLPFRKQLV